MPNRILRDWTDSETVNSLSPHGERLFIRLIMKADDYGRYTANPKLMRASLFPLLIDSIREADITRWLAECEKAGLIALYQIGDKPLLEIRDFGQRLRDSKPKYPAPGDYVSSPPSAATSGDFRLESETDAETEMPSAGRSKPPVAEKFPLESVRSVVLAFKIKLGIPEEDKAWDKVYWARYSKSAKELLILFDGSVERCADCIEALADGFDRKTLDWTPETIKRRAGEWKHGRLRN